MYNEFKSLWIYRELNKFITFRKMEFVGHIPETLEEPAKWMSDKTFTNQILDQDYITIKCNNLIYTEVTTYILLLGDINRFQKDSKRVKKIIESIPGYRQGDRMEIVIIGREPFDSHRTKAMDSMKKESVEIIFVPYRFVRSNPFNHMYAVTHEIMTKEEIESTFDWFIIGPIDLPKIKRSERMMIWLNPMIGDIIRISCIGDTGITIEYRVVE